MIRLAFEVILPIHRAVILAEGFLEFYADEVSWFAKKFSYVADYAFFSVCSPDALTFLVSIAHV